MSTKQTTQQQPETTEKEYHEAIREAANNPTAKNKERVKELTKRIKEVRAKRMEEKVSELKKRIEDKQGYAQNLEQKKTKKDLEEVSREKRVKLLLRAVNEDYKEAIKLNRELRDLVDESVAIKKAAREAQATLRSLKKELKEEGGGD